MALSVIILLRLRPSLTKIVEVYFLLLRAVSFHLSVLLASCWARRKYVSLMLLCFVCFTLDGYENARRLCDLYYVNSPELELEELNGKPAWGRQSK